MKLHFPLVNVKQPSRLFGKMRQNSLLLLLLPALLVVLLGACRDEDFVNTMSLDPNYDTKGELLPVTSPGGLIQNNDGTWSTNNCRVPLVGPGRVVNQIVSSFVSALEVGKDWTALIDTDLTNGVELKKGVSVELAYQPIVSVKDLYRTYAKGHKVGFIYKESGGLLELKVLEAFVIELYRDGECVQTTKFNEGNGGVIDLNLLSVNKGNEVGTREISVIANVPFDEVRLSLGGIEVQALNNGFTIHYAFVGENPEIRATSEPDFVNFWTKDKSPVCNDNSDGFLKPKMTEGYGLVNLGVWVNKDNPVDVDEANYASYEMVASLLGGGTRYTVNFNKEIPAGYELGMSFSSSELLGANLLGKTAPILRTYGKDVNAPDNTLESSEVGTELLGLGLLSGSSQAVTAMVSSKPCWQLQIDSKFGVANVLGNLYVYYAYVREPISLDPSAYFTFADDTTYISNYRLPKQPAECRSLQYAVISQPYGASANIETKDGGYSLTGATKEGVYRIQALYTAPNGKQLSQIANIYRMVRSSKSGCNIYITADSHGAYATEAIGWSGCLLCLFNGTNNANAVVDKDPDNYAVRYGLLQLVDWEPILAVRMNKSIVPELNKEIRTGFVVQPNNAILGVNLLDHYLIRLYLNGNLVDEGSGGKGGLLNAGLISDEDGRVRISMKTDKEFDQIELWSKKLLSLDLLNQLRVYNIFYEDASCSDDLVSETCMEVMTDLHHGLQIDYDAMSKKFTTASVGGSMDGLGYLLDGSLSTGVKVNGILKLLDTGGVIALKFDKLPANQPVGVALEGLPSLLSLDLLSGTQLKVYNDDVQVGDAMDFGTIGLNLLGKNGRAYIETIPKLDYNRVEIILGKGLADVSLASAFKVTGLYTRPDRDGDGIPDCSETESETAVELVGNARTCEGSDLVVRVNTEAEVGTLYLLECKNQTTGQTYEKEVALKIDSEGKYFGIPDLTKGKYLVSVYALGSGECLWNGAYATVHPQLTEWTGAVSTEWSEWNNWTDGAPWECTNVIIPSDVKQYPVIAEGDCCQNIHFEEGTAALNTHLLTYEKAFVDMRVKGGRYSYLSAPLQEMVTGDMYINPNLQWAKEDYFTVMNTENYPENRINPIVYQRIWGGTREDAYELPAEGNGVPVQITETGWSRDFNSVTMGYNAGDGFSLRPGKEGDYNSYRFRFPKAKDVNLGSGVSEGETYSYYSEDGEFIRKETFGRKTEYVGRFFGNADGTVNVSLTADYGGYFLVGNPYMAYISVSAFMRENGITELRMYDGNTNRTVLINGGDVLTSDSELPAVIAPMQSVLVKTTASEVSFTAAMQVQPAQATRASRSLDNGLYISAFKGGYTATCLLGTSASADNAYRVSEDAEILMDSESMPVVEVFTVAGSKALNIQQVKDAVRIPLGICLRTPGDVRLMFSSAGVMWEDWKLEDTKTGQTYGMEELKQGITVAGMQSNSGRLVLVKD